MNRRNMKESSPADVDHGSLPGGAQPESEAGSQPRGRLHAIWDTIGAVIGVVMGLVPHVLHHIGLIAGAALVTGAGGNLLFFALGLIFSIPLIRRLYRKFHSWWAPAIAIAIFAAMFSLSAFVIGPAITGDSSPANAPTAPSQTPTEDHSEHHGG